MCCISREADAYNFEFRSIVATEKVWHLILVEEDVVINVRWLVGLYYVVSFKIKGFCFVCTVCLCATAGIPCSVYESRGSFATANFRGTQHNTATRVNFSEGNMFVIINRAESNLNDIGTRSQLKYLTAPQHTNHIAKDYFWKCFPSYSFFLLKTSENFITIIRSLMQSK